MKLRLKAAAAALLAVGFLASYAYASDATPPAKKHTATKKEKAPPQPSVDDQIQALRQELQGQIDTLKSSLADKDAQLKQAQQQAADAQAAAAKAQAAADAQQQIYTQNQAAVSTLQSTVNDLKADEVSLATNVSDSTAAIKKDIANPTTLHYKGVNITPGGFIDADTIYRTKALGMAIPTSFNNIPYEGDDRYKLSEFYGSATPTRLSLLAEGKTGWGTLRGYYEADFQGVGTSSNNNQTTSYVLRQRVLYGEAEMSSGWKVAGGQMWSMVTEGNKGIPSSPSAILTPLTIDTSYMPGFIWARQYSLRVVKSLAGGKFTAGAALENPQLIYTASLAGNTPYAVLGASGNSSGFNAAISASVPTTYIQNYTTQVGTSSVSGVIPVEVPVYNTIYANTNIANYSFNQAPDVIVKAVADPGWGHYEIFGLAGFAHETVYPGVTTNSTKYGGQYDIFCPSGTTVNTVACTPVAAVSSISGSYTDSIVLGGFGGALRVPVVKDKFNFGFKAMYGPGMGRYGDSTLADVTADANGNLAPIHNASGLFTLEATPTKRLTLWINYGGDYAARVDFASSTTTSLGSPTAYFCPAGYTSGTPSTLCTKTASAVTADGVWGGHWSTPSEAAVGYGSRLAVNYAAATSTPPATGCDVTAAPGYNGSSTGYYASSPASCVGHTRDVQELTGGWWYDIYKSDHGRFRQGFQYGYLVREGWSGASGYGAKGIDNAVWTSLKYYLP